MSKLRKTLALLLCLAVCLTLMPAAFAEEPAGDYLVWEDAPVANESAPVITAQPASISVTEGATASFTVKASGTNLKYQWKFYAAGTAVPQNAASTTATLKFTATEAQNGYAYFCEIKNGGGTVTTDYAFLTVSAGSGTVTRPSITTQPKSVTAADGTQTTFSVRASGSGLKYQWQYRTSSSGSWTNSSAASGTTRDFVVNARTAINGYQYRCKVSNSAGAVYTSVVTLTVIPSTVSKPVITKHPANFSAPNGTQTTISVTATGSGLKYQWQYRTSSSGSWTNSSAASANSRIFTVNARTAINGYQYRCKVSNSAGYVYSNVATLTVTNITKPTITTQPKSVTAADGTQTTFSVRASGSGLKYQWQYRTSSSGSWTNSSAASGTTRDFVVNARTAINGYQYRCKVSNSAGTVYTSIVKLTVVTKPTITTQPKSVTVAAGTQTTFSVTAKGGSLKYQWQYRTSASGSWTNSTAASGTTKDFLVNARTAINGYQYRCKVSNVAGYVYTNVVTLTIKSNPVTRRALLVAETAAPGCRATPELWNGDVPLVGDVLLSVNGGAYQGNIRTLKDPTASGVTSAIASAFSGADDNDVSFFYIASHGVDDPNASDAQKGALAMHDGNLLYLRTLANALRQVPGKKIIVVMSCGSGAGIFPNGEGYDPDAFNQLVIDAFAAVDEPLAPNDLESNTGEWSQSQDNGKFYVITSSDINESSLAAADGDGNVVCSVFGYCFYMSLKESGNFPASGSNKVTFGQLCSYLYDQVYNFTGGYQHVQFYPRSSSFELFTR